MIKCPNCSNLSEPYERYCSQCYTVFPSGTHEAASLRLRAKNAAAGRWKVPSLIVITLLGAAFVSIDANDPSPKTGSLGAGARDMKRAIIKWVGK